MIYVIDNYIFMYTRHTEVVLRKVGGATKEICGKVILII